MTDEMRIAVIIPARDEAESLPGVLRALPPVGRVIVVDNGSIDGTAAEASRLGAEVVHAPRHGYGTAVLAGMGLLRPAPPEVLVILDADHADPPERIMELAGPVLRGEADLVQTDRTRLAERGALTLPQRFGNRLTTFLIARLTGHVYRDMGPFRAIRWSSLESLEMEDPTWGWNVEMQLKAVKHGLRIREVPLPYRTRTKGESKISGSVRGVLRAGARILWAVCRYR